MKTLIILTAALMLPTILFSQCKYLVNEKDEFTGKIERQTDIVSIGKGAFASVGRTDSMFYIMASADIGCVSPGKSKIYIKFTDGTILELTHAGKISCSALPPFVASINDDMETLMQKDVAKCRISGTERYVDFDFKDPNYFKKFLPCVQ